MCPWRVNAHGRAAHAPVRRRKFGALDARWHPARSGHRQVARHRRHCPHRSTVVSTAALNPAGMGGHRVHLSLLPARAGCRERVAGSHGSRAPSPRTEPRRLDGDCRGPRARPGSGYERPTSRSAPRQRWRPGLQLEVDEDSLRTGASRTMAMLLNRQKAAACGRRLMTDRVDHEGPLRRYPSSPTDCGHRDQRPDRR